MEEEIILITGVGGWLGSELTLQLLKQGRKVRAFNRNLTKSLEQLKNDYGDLLEIVIGDILDSQNLEKAFKGINEVYHLAAKVHYIPTNKKEEEEFYKINTDATQNIFKYCLKYNVKRVIFFSSVSVFKNSNKMIFENSKKDPETIYGKSKLKAEKLGKEYYKKYNLPITIIEPVTVYGEGDIGNFAKLERMVKKGIVIFFGKQENKKTIIYYKDLINMVIEIAKDSTTIGRSIICGTETLSVKEIYNILINKQSKKVIRIKIPEFFTKLIIKICKFSILKKIGRKVKSLTENSEFDLKECEKYLENKKTTFESFELKDNQTKKVLFVATVTNHIKTFHIPYLKWFKEQGYEVHVASNGNEKIEYCDKHFNLPFERFPLKSGNFKAYKELKKIINNNNYKIIHCHTPVGGVLTRLAARKIRKKGTRVIYTAHGFHFYKGAPLLNWLIYYPVEKICARWTDCLITINEEDYNLAKTKFKAKEVELINGVGVDENKFNFIMLDSEKEKIRQTLNLKKDDFVLIQVGELNKNKNQIMTIEAMKKIIETNKNVKLLLVGKGNLKEYYEEKVKEYHLENNVFLLGYRKDIPKLLKISDCLISTSKREGLPVNLIEAAMSGIPIIATNCRGNREIAKRVIDIDDTNGLCENIKRCVENKKDYICEDIDKYKIKNILKKMEVIYNEKIN